MDDHLLAFLLSCACLESEQFVLTSISICGSIIISLGLLVHFEVIKAFFMDVSWQLLLAQLLQVWVRLIQSFELFHW